MIIMAIQPAEHDEKYTYGIIDKKATISFLYRQWMLKELQICD